MLLKPRYPYNPIDRIDSPLGRKYVTPDGRKLPSVTTILDKTKSDEKKQILLNWKNRVGHKNAADIVYAASGRGTVMHRFLERYVLGEELKAGSNHVQAQAFKMANVIIDTMMKPHVSEVWGTETGLYFPELYAGTTDCVGLWDDTPSIMDFKQTNKPKKEEWIEDYYLQLAAYANAHNEVYGTDIRQGVVMMCSGDLEPQTFILTGDKFDEYTDKWWSRVERYYRENN